MFWQLRRSFWPILSGCPVKLVPPEKSDNIVGLSANLVLGVEVHSLPALRVMIPLVVVTQVVGIKMLYFLAAVWAVDRLHTAYYKRVMVIICHR